MMGTATINRRAILAGAAAIPVLAGAGQAAPTDPVLALCAQWQSHKLQADQIADRAHAGEIAWSKVDGVLDAHYTESVALGRIVQETQATTPQGVAAKLRVLLRDSQDWIDDDDALFIANAADNLVALTT